MSAPKEERETPSPLKDSQDHHHHHHHHLYPHQQQYRQDDKAASSTHVEISREPPPPLFVTPFDFEAVNVKRPRLTISSSSSAQWKPISSSSPQQLQGQMGIQNPESSPSPSNTQAQFPSPDTSSSPLPTQETTVQPEHSQFRKGKFVSPVWKPHEMLWLARAWRVQHQGVDGSGHEHRVGSGRGKTRADKDREVAEFLNSHGVNRDAKTAATKWDNMLGEFRKVYEWERGGEREQVGKSYFRLSPYERKIHRLPASFDEQVFEELSQFMCSRLKPTSHNLHHQSSRSLMTSSNLNIPSDLNVKALPPPPPPIRDQEDFPLSCGRTRQMESYMMQNNTRSALLGRLDPHPLLDVGMSPLSWTSGGSSRVELRRIGRMRMTWEESVSLWAEEGEYHRGRVKVHGSSFMDSDELVYFDDSMVACALEAFEGGPLKGFSVDRFLLGQHLKVFGRKKPFTPSYFTPSQPSGFSERTPDPVTEPSSRCEFQDPTEYYLSCLKVPPATLPSLVELSWYIKEPPLEEFRLPLRKDIYCQLPQGKELFFTPSSDPYLDCKSFMIDILSSIIRPTPIISSLTSTCRDSFIPLWDDCINRVIGKFCPLEVIFVRKQTNTSLSTSFQNQWPNITGLVRNLCLWRGEEIHQQRSDQSQTSDYNPSSTITQKISWTYHDLPYVLGYHTIGPNVTFCALSSPNPQSTDDQTRIIRTDLYSLDLSNPSERLKGIVPCWRIGVLLAALAEKCCNRSYSDFGISDDGNGNYIEMTPTTVTKFYPSKRRWQEVKEIYEVLDGRVAHAERIVGQDERELALVFKPRGVKAKPKSYEELVVALKQVTTALVGLHDMGFMHRDLCWEKVMMVVRTSEEGEKREEEWFVGGFEEAVGAPQINPWKKSKTSSESGRYAPEMTRGVHGVKVDMWGVGYLIKTSGVVMRPTNEKQLNELERRCMDQNPEQRPTAADCYHQLLQIQSSATAALPKTH